VPDKDDVELEALDAEISGDLLEEWTIIVITDPVHRYTGVGNLICD
jgi:hypothetical protein